MNLPNSINPVRNIYPFLMALIPGVVFVLLIHPLFGWSIFDYAPNIYNDEVGYWRYILTFKEVGFNGGYYSPNEVLAPLQWVKFDAHGPVFPMIYGSLANITGWEPYSAFFINFGLLTFALFFFMRNMKRSEWFLTILVVISFWPVLLYLGSAFQETINHVVAIIFAAIFAQLIDGKRTPKLFLILFPLIFFFALMRYSWAVLFFPLFIYFGKRKSLGSYVSRLVIAGSFVVFTVWIFGLLTPRGSDIVLEKLHGEYPSAGLLIQAALTSMAENLKNNAQTLISLNNPVDSLLFVQLVLLILLLVFAAIKNVSSSDIRRHASFHFFNLIPVAFALMIFESNFERVISAHLLLSYLIITRLGPRWILFVTITINLLAAPLVLSTFQDWWEPNYVANDIGIPKDKLKVNEILRYENHPQTPWCNTILISLADYDRRLLSIPAGIGISYMHRRLGELESFPKSKYVLGEQLIDKFGEGNFDLLSQLPIGKIYLNKRSVCNSDQQPHNE